MNKGPLQRLVDILYDAFTRLQANCSMHDLEKIAVLVHRSMTAHTRYFHSLEHVFNFSPYEDPILALAALFHDIVYFQVDQGFFPEIETLVTPYLRQTPEGFFLVDHFNPDDLTFRMSLEVFDFKPGQLLSPNSGLNEFLSAFVMNKKLEHIISTKDKLYAAVCIEATIPFQGINSNGETHFDLLETRLQSINQNYSLNLDQVEIDQALKLAVSFSNKDVESFSEPDAGNFLDNTWKLLPETNVALRWEGIYSVREYRRAIQNMEIFFSKLNPDSIFNFYQDTPPHEQYVKMVEQAHLNVYTAREYLRVKLLAVAILEAFAELTGGDAPLTLFTGGMRQDHEYTGYEEFFTEPRISSSVDEESIILRLLGSGRGHEIGFDMKNSPLSFFLFTRLGQPEIDTLVRGASLMFAGNLDPQQFLAQIDVRIVAAIARACAQTALTRREKLSQLFPEP